MDLGALVFEGEQDALGVLDARDDLVCFRLLACESPLQKYSARVEQRFTSLDSVICHE